MVANILNLGQEGVGYPFLGVILIISFFLVMLTSPKRLLKIDSRELKSLILLITFFLYCFLSIGLRTLDLSKVKALTLGTSSGILFAISFGWLLSACIDIIKNNLKANKLYIYLHNISLFACVLVSLLIVTGLLSFSSDKHLLVTESAGAYQRPANLMIMSLMVIAAISLVVCEIYNSFFIRCINVISVLLISLSLCLISQLLGSNMGFIACFLILVTYLFCVLFQGGRVKNDFRNFNIYSLLLDRKGYFWRVCAKFSLAIISVLFLIISFVDVPFDKLRITGYGSGEASSVSSRSKIIEKNFIDQLSYNPIFGHPEVDKILYTEGEYVHSLILSLLTHTGVFGLTLFVLILYFLYKERLTSSDMPGGRSYSIFRIAIILIILLLGTFFTFYAWMPFWFALGLFGFSRHT